MIKIILMMVALAAVACDAPNQSSERGAGSETEDRAPVDPAEESPSIHSDTTTSGGMNRPNQYDTLK